MPHMADGGWDDGRYKATYSAIILELQSHSGDNPLKFQVVGPQVGTAVLIGLSVTIPPFPHDHNDAMSRPLVANNGLFKRCLSWPVLP